MSQKQQHTTGPQHKAVDQTSSGAWDISKLKKMSELTTKVDEKTAAGGSGIDDLEALILDEIENMEEEQRQADAKAKKKKKEKEKQKELEELQNTRQAMREPGVCRCF